jgi:hypothetical protein
MQEEDFRMVNRVAVLCLVLGAAGGYAVAGSSAGAESAQQGPTRPMFVDIGEEVTLTFERGTFGEHIHSVPCTVAEVRSSWVRCAPADVFQARRERDWYNFEYMIRITEREK